jgi:hypothetical protein
MAKVENARIGINFVDIFITKIASTLSDRVLQGVFSRKDALKVL